MTGHIENTGMIEWYTNEITFIDRKWKYSNIAHVLFPQWGGITTANCIWMNYGKHNKFVGKLKWSP